MRYVALLRAVNVGGNNKVAMKELKAVFESVGMTSVRTYINSGNVIFASPMGDRAVLTKLLEEAIEKRFDARVDVVLRDEGGMRSIVRALPAGWTNDQTMKCDVVFLRDQVDRPSVLDELDFKPEIEDVLYVPGAIIRRVDRENAARSGLLKIVGTPLYKQVTIRNCNTTRKLLELMEE
jgi:uncharacterized protein (DUF1697 family)